MSRDSSPSKRKERVAPSILIVNLKLLIINLKLLVIKIQFPSHSHHVMEAIRSKTFCEGGHDFLDPRRGVGGASYKERLPVLAKGKTGGTSRGIDIAHDPLGQLVIRMGSEAKISGIRFSLLHHFSRAGRVDRRQRLILPDLA